jgi:hypothetical protein
MLAPRTWAETAQDGRDQDRDGDPDREVERAALIAAITAAYLLTPSEQKALAEALYAGRLAAAIASYRQAAAAVGADVPDDYEPDDVCLEDLATAATTHARSIAHTYQRDMEMAALLFLRAWEQQHGDTLDTARAGPALRQHLGQWADERADWKSEQIARAETGAGADAGVDQFIADLRRGTAVDSTGQPIDSSGAVVAILPDYSSPDGVCSDYAGNVYALEAYDSLPDFPAHPNCIHEKVILLSTDVGVATDDAD